MRPSRPVSPARLTALISALIFLDMITWLAAVPLIPVWQRDYGLTDDQSGIVLGAYAFAVLVAAIPAGHLSDRIGARRTMLIGATAFVVAAPALAVADSFALLLAVRVAQGMCSAVTWSAGLAWLTNALDAPHRPRGLAISNASATVAMIAGPILGGPIVARVGVVPAFAGLGVLAAIGLAWALLEPGGASDVGRHDEQHGPFEALRRAARPGHLQMAYLAIAFAAIVGAALQLLGPLRLAEDGLSSAAIGWVYTAGSALAVGAIVVVARLGTRLDHVRTLIVMPAVCAGCVALMLVPAGTASYIVLLDALMLFSAPVYTIAFASCATGARDAGVGEGGAFGMLNAIWAAGSVLAPVLAGFLSQHGPAWSMYAVIVAASVVFVILLQRSASTVRRQEART